jgi:hypothetical protein
MNDGFASVLVLAIGGVALFIGWKILVAVLKGLSSAGDTITSAWPAFFEKVWVSVASGVVSGLVVGFMLGGDVKWASATGIGVAGAKLLYDIFNA